MTPERIAQLRARDFNAIEAEWHNPDGYFEDPDSLKHELLDEIEWLQHQLEAEVGALRAEVRRAHSSNIVQNSPGRYYVRCACRWKSREGARSDALEQHAAHAASIIVAAAMGTPFWKEAGK